MTIFQISAIMKYHHAQFHLFLENHFLENHNRNSISTCPENPVVFVCLKVISIQESVQKAGRYFLPQSTHRAKFWLRQNTPMYLPLYDNSAFVSKKLPKQKKCKCAAPQTPWPHKWARKFLVSWKISTFHWCQGCASVSTNLTVSCERCRLCVPPLYLFFSMMCRCSL